MPLYSLVTHFASLFFQIIIIIIIIIFLQRSEVQGAIYEGSQKIRFPILLPPNNFT
jgi:preprotein translocase subunit SecG